MAHGDAGSPLTKDSINDAAAQIARQWFAVAESTEKFKSFIEGITDPALVALGFSTDGISDLRSGMADASDMAGIFNNTAPVAALPYDYREFLIRLISPGLY